MNQAASTEHPDNKVNTFIAKSPVNTGLLADIRRAAAAQGMEKNCKAELEGGLGQVLKIKSMVKKGYTVWFE